MQFVQDLNKYYMAANTYIYSDIMNSFMIHPIKKDLVLLTDIDAVNRSLKNIIQTNFYERPYDPLYGANLRHYMFENYDQSIENEMKIDIQNAIDNHEPRVIVNDISISGDPDTHELNISITYQIKNISSNSIIFSTTLKRSR